jgi:tetratricopeptide (TPR) repeat protein
MIFGVSWREINRRIEECRRGSDPIICLCRLFEETRDGMVAFALAEEYEKSGNLEDALRYFKEAEERFPRERYKNLARERWMEIERRLEHRASVDDGVLFIVSCTGDKIWRENPNADRYVPAKDAYTGETVRSWLANPLSSEKKVAHPER